ncbi:MBG domain-containing protein [Limosilactobacillus caccae]|uniref:MBG domain-containing protein n=1 Tax=Limosilactobacillus caccae TaxID=1926284 RepID=UPI0009711B59|nr:MBG domain-containing protein [Limosilactobacillus caccae]
MGKNNRLNNVNSQRKNYRLYKAKKQWITACATFFFTLGASAAVMTSNAAAADDPATGTTREPQVEEVNSSASSSAEKSDTPAVASSSPEGSNAAKQGDSSAASSASVAGEPQKSNVPEQPGAARSIPTVSFAAAPESNTNTEGDTNIAPEGVQSMDEITGEMNAVMKGTDIAGNAAVFIKNAAELKQAGAKITWEKSLTESVDPNGMGNILSGTVLVTYEDGKTTSVNVSAYALAPAMTLNGAANNRYYYINNIGDGAPTSAQQPDANGMMIYDPKWNEKDSAGNDLNRTTILVPYIGDDTTNSLGFNFDEFSIELPKQIDTSSIGIKFFQVKITPNQSNPTQYANLLNTGAVTVNIPYLVKDLPLKADTGQPVYVQKGNNGAVSAGDKGEGYFDSTVADASSENSTGFGRYFYGTAANGYQDYALAYALGIGAVGDFNNTPGAPNPDADSMEIWINVPNAEHHKFQVIQVAPKDLPDSNPLYIFRDSFKLPQYQPGGPMAIQGPSAVVNALNDNDNLEYVKNEMLPAIDGQVTGSYIKNASPAVLDSDNNRHFTFKYNPYYGGFVASGQSQIPLLSTSNSANVTIPFRDEIAKAFDSLGTNSSWGQLSGGGGYGPMNLRAILRSKEYLDSMYYAQDGDIYIIDRPVAKDVQDNIIDVSNGGVTLTGDKAAILLKNPTTLDGKWPAGTTFTWVSDATGKTQADPMTFDKAGETKQGFLKVHLPMPNGISDGQQKRWFDGVIEVTAQSKAKTYNPGGDFAYGEAKTAAELVQNKSAFPDGTTFHYAGKDAKGNICYQNSDGNWVYEVKDSEGKVQQVAASGKVTSTEPDWTKWGEYSNVYIYADYAQTDVNGNVVGRAQSTPSHGIVTIDRFVNYYVVEGGDLPTDPSTLVQFDADVLKDNELTFSKGFTEVGSDAAANLSNEKSNQAQFTVNIKNKKLGTTNTVKVYLNVVVIPKIDGVGNQWFNANGSHNQDVDTDHQTGDYTIANKQAASKLTDYTAADASYIGYDFHKDPNNPNEGTFSEATKEYKPGMTVTGLTPETGELTGGKQTAIVRIDVPKGAHGGNGIVIQSDSKGDYYNLKVPINVIFKGEITLSGPQTVTYNGEAQKINQKKAKGKYLGELDISNPASDKNVDKITKVSVELTADDLQFLDENGDPLTTPVINAGTYPVLLTKSGVDKVEKEIAEKSEKTGYKYDFSDTKPNIADFVVEKAKVGVTVSAAGNKTYDGKAVTDLKPSLTITTVNGKEPLGPITLPNVSDVTKLGLIAGEDYEWYLSDAKGNKIGSALTEAPTNAGNYTIGLTEAGQNKIANLNKDNIEWTVKT